MSLEEVQQNMADATGLVVDRSVSPPKVLGQTFMVSRSRAVTCASVVYNYSEAPWALQINFIHPNVALGVRSVAIHPDFDKKAARNWYLGQTGNPGEQLVLNNDIATITLDTQLNEMPLDRIGELNRALSLPFSSAGVESSGNIAGDEFLNILRGLVQGKRDGLLTVFDARNIPLARLQLTGGAISKVYYRGLLGELAFFELVYRKPGLGYAFQTAGDFNWGQVRDITAPADALVQEAMRRAAEMPNIFGLLGGSEARYQQRIENYDAASMASESIQWFAERLWSCIDGYLTLDQMSERAGADTYTVLQAIREMVNKAQVSLRNVAPFHYNGVLGTPLIAHTDFEVHAWDPLQGFYLDPVSGRPTWLQGNFFGVANALQPKNMLHTIPIPIVIPGAMILKDYKMIGIHTGAHPPKPGQPLPPVKTFQYMWMGALLDIGTGKKSGDPSASDTSLAALRTKSADEQLTAAPASLERFECPSCHATNTKAGPCFNCGTQIDPPVVDEDAVPKSQTGKLMADLEAKTKIPQKQLLILGGGVIAIIIVLIVSMSGGGGGGSAPPTVSTDQSSGHPNSEKAMKLAVKYAGFKPTAIPGYWYEDTTDLTKPDFESFGVYSDQANQKLLFVVMPTTAPLDKLRNFIGLPPYADVFRADSGNNDIKVDESSQVLGNGYFHWYVGKYTMQHPADGEDPATMILVGAFPSPETGKSILVVGRALKSGGVYDYKSASYLIDQMASDYTAQGNADRTKQKPKSVDEGENKTASSDKKAEEMPLATDKEIDQFAVQLADDIQSKLKAPDDAQDELKKKKPKGLKATINVGINTQDGTITKLEITHPAEIDSITQALSKAINSAAPFKDAPRTKDGSMNVEVTVNKDKGSSDLKVTATRN